MYVGTYSAECIEENENRPDPRTSGFCNHEANLVYPPRNLYVGAIESACGGNGAAGRPLAEMMPSILSRMPTVEASKAN